MLTKAERELVLEYFGMNFEDLSKEEFERKLKELRFKYHPDKFEKFQDELVKELSESRYKEIEQLAEKIRKVFDSQENRILGNGDVMDQPPLFAYKGLKIEIVTREKDLKYYLFGTHYRWLERGDKYTIKGTRASIIIDSDYFNHSVGFLESIKMYLTFSETDSLETIFEWLYRKIQDYAMYLIIEGKKVQVDLYEMLTAVKKISLLNPGKDTSR